MSAPALQQPGAGTPRRSRRRIVAFVILAFLLVFVTALIDRLVYFRKVSVSFSAVKGIGAVCLACGENLPKGPASGIDIIKRCDPDVPAQFAEMAKELTVLKGGCNDKTVIAWGPELHYWAENWMPFAPRSGRAVFFDDLHTRFVSLTAFEELGCP